MDTGINFLPRGSEIFPGLLAEIPDPPIGLYTQGTLPPHGTASIAIVGSRRATPTGLSLCRNFARELAARGFSIISGLAFGIDAAAHEGALEAHGHTVAVLPCGLDHIYPRSNTAIAKKILDNNGALVSEYPAGTEALPFRFLERNRIVSGLARGTLIIEAPEKSGALATARFAAEQNRDCFVIPGSISHPNFVGSHDLIRKGAELVTKVEDILEAYGMQDAVKPNAISGPIFKHLSDEEKIMYGILKKSPEALEVDKLIQTSTLQPHVVNIAITMLLVKGIIKETASGYIIA